MFTWRFQRKNYLQKYKMCFTVCVYGKTITHLLAKLYIASFLSWNDKCLSAGVLPNDLAAGCEQEKAMIDNTFPLLHHLCAI